MFRHGRTRTGESANRGAAKNQWWGFLYFPWVRDTPGERQNHGPPHTNTPHTESPHSDGPRPTNSQARRHVLNPSFEPAGSSAYARWLGRARAGVRLHFDAHVAPTRACPHLAHVDGAALVEVLVHLSALLVAVWVHDASHSASLSRAVYSHCQGGPLEHILGGGEFLCGGPGRRMRR